MAAATARQRMGWAAVRMRVARPLAPRACMSTASTGMARDSEGPPRRRIAFQFKATSDPALQAEYKQHHAAVWPDMQQALARAGWHNYSLFMKADGTLFGYFESELTLAECIANMEKEPVNAVWQAEMKKYFPSTEGRPDEAMVELEEVMHLDI